MKGEAATVNPETNYESVGESLHQPSASLNGVVGCIAPLASVHLALPLGQVTKSRDGEDTRHGLRYARSLDQWLAPACANKMIRLTGERKTMHKLHCFAIGNIPAMNYSRAIPKIDQHFDQRIPRHSQQRLQLTVAQGDEKGT